MKELEELVARVRQLSPDELERFGTWFVRYEASCWEPRDTALSAEARQPNTKFEAGNAKLGAGDDVTSYLSCTISRETAALLGLLPRDDQNVSDDKVKPASAVVLQLRAKSSKD